MVLALYLNTCTCKHTLNCTLNKYAYRNTIKCLSSYKAWWSLHGVRSKIEKKGSFKKANSKHSKDIDGRTKRTHRNEWGNNQGHGWSHMDHNPDNGRDTIEGGRNTMRTQDRWSDTKAASVQLGCDGQVFRVESLHARGKKCIIHLQHARAWQDCQSKKLVRKKRIAFHWEYNRSRKAGMQHSPRVTQHTSN